MGSIPTPFPGYPLVDSSAYIGNFWSSFDLVLCREPDGTEKTRRIEPGTFPLVDGFPGRAGLLKGYGNAIVPQVAAEFIGAYLDARAMLTPGREVA